MVSWSLLPPSVHTYSTFNGGVAPRLVAAPVPLPPIITTQGSVLEQVGGEGQVEEQQDGGADVEAQKNPSSHLSSRVLQSQLSSLVRSFASPSSYDTTPSPGHVVLYAVFACVCIVGFMFVYWDEPDRL